jgi:hypothetical protein
MKWIVTGVDVYGKRFRIVTVNRIHAFGINLYNGSVWRVDPDGKRVLRKRVKNGTHIFP